MKNYTFTEDWFSHDGLWVLNDLDINKELHFLEIGTFEGKSTIWFLENILQNKKSTITCVDPWLDYSLGEDSLNSYGLETSPWKLEETKTKERFLQNILESGDSDKVKIIQDLSNHAIPQLICQNKKYDLIFIDGNHVAPYVLMDAVMSWSLLNVGGYMMFDDYVWGMDSKVTLRPKNSIDAFGEIFGDYVVDVYSHNRKIYKREK
jgi:predicted O-methyltransferase YrrM